MNATQRWNAALLLFEAIAATVAHALGATWLTLAGLAAALLLTGALGLLLVVRVLVPRSRRRYERELRAALAAHAAAGPAPDRHAPVDVREAA